MQILIHNGVNMCMEYLKLMEDDHFSLECNYRDIYRIMINKLISIVIVLSFSTNHVFSELLQVRDYCYKNCSWLLS